MLWYLRQTKSRSLAQALVLGGHVRLNGKRVEKSSVEVKAGDTLTLPKGEDVVVLQIVAIPAQRGPATQMQACYIEI